MEKINQYGRKRTKIKNKNKKPKDKKKSFFFWGPKWNVLDENESAL